MNNPLLNFVLLVLSLAVAATGAVFASGQINLLTVGMLLLGGYGLGVTFPSFWARLRGVKTSPQTSSTTQRAERSARRRGSRRGAERRQRGDRQRAEKRGERDSRAEKRARSKSRKKAVRNVGTVKWFDDSKGYGFITPEDGGDDCFVHKSVVSNGGTLVEGAKVEFEFTKDDRGRVAAANVVKL